MKKLKIFENNGEFIEGGDGSGVDISTINKNQLAVGKLVEMEHTNTSDIAQEIAVDHLSKIPTYYTILIYAGLCDEKDALELAFTNGVADKAIYEKLKANNFKFY